uniref:Uncharacterized protein n=1 Tax=Anguilla anguilla TaxID=7936 RepID=A0A0E9SNR8_ANGAN
MCSKLKKIKVVFHFRNDKCSDHGCQTGLEHQEEHCCKTICFAEGCVQNA